MGRLSDDEFEIGRKRWEAGVVIGALLCIGGFAAFFGGFMLEAVNLFIFGIVALCIGPQIWLISVFKAWRRRE